MKSLKDKLSTLRNFHKEHGYLPTYEHMRTLFNYQSKSTAYYAINRLIDQGYLRRKSNKLEPGENFDGLPYFESVKAGFPSPAEEEANDRLSLDDYLIERPHATMLIRVKGDSMIDAGIFEGDVLVVERTPEAKSGDIVVANLEGEFTVKFLHKQGDRLRLLPANSAYPPIDLSAYTHQSIVGVVRGSVRKY
ncbi:repressor LexA [Candidatus Peregrinibacteria bacterium]|nr:MAG: repressor LexA [Candidatus Peregrinibacteria bacterium]